MLQCFQLTSGLKINYGKSNIYSSHCPDSLLHEGARILYCKLGSWPMNYLGVPIGLTARKRIFWEPLVRIMKTKLASWKASSLNQAGRLTLVKAVLDNLPVYWMHLHQIPQSVTEDLERIRRNFFWGSTCAQNAESRKLHLTSWSKVCQPKAVGGLGIVLIRYKNLSLLGKWSYRWIN